MNNENAARGMMKKSFIPGVQVETRVVGNSECTRNFYEFPLHATYINRLRNVLNHSQFILAKTMSVD